MLIKYLCLLETKNDVIIGLRENKDELYVDILKGETCVNIASVRKDKFERLELDNKEFIVNLITTIITDFYLNVKLKGLTTLIHEKNKIN